MTSLCQVSQGEEVRCPPCPGCRSPPIAPFAVIATHLCRTWRKKGDGNTLVTPLSWTFFSAPGAEVGSETGKGSMCQGAGCRISDETCHDSANVCAGVLVG